MLIFSGIMAWISLLLFIILVLKFLVKFLAIEFEFFRKINKFFSKTHKPLGIIIIFTSLIHALTSSAFIFSFNLGTLTFIFFIVLTLSYIFKRYYKPRFLLIHRILTLITVILVIAHIIDVGGLNLIHRITYKNEEYIENLDKLNDGIYEGIGDGLKGKTKVTVEIVNGKIKDIILLETSDSKEYMDKAVQGLKNEIIKRNSTNIDIIAGATNASNVYLNAIRDALKKAKQ